MSTDSGFSSGRICTSESQKESKAVHRYNCLKPPEKCHGQVHTDGGCFLKRLNLHTPGIRDAKERGV